MRFLLVLITLTALLPHAHATSEQGLDPNVSTQTLVFLRHGERPPGGHGQITPQGLLRALALPDVLLKKFGKPDFIFAPSPLAKVKELDTGKHYYYLRPLATIEPTAIRCGLPVNVSIGYTQIGKLRRELERPQYRNATIFIAWEHLEIVQLVRDLLKKYGANPAQVPDWSNDDYDPLYIVTITRTGHRVISTTFQKSHEGLNKIKPSAVRLSNR